MKSFVQAVVVAATLIAPVVSFAQSNNGPVTREQVRAELVQLEKAGYNPTRGADPYYPTDIQAAEARVAAQNAATSGMGGVISGSSASAGPVAARAAASNATESIYFGH